MEVPKTDVEFIGEDLESVFQYKFQHMKNRDPESYIRLAQWCQLVNLNDRAIEQLERAVKLAPQSARARGLLESARRTSDSPVRTAPPAPPPPPLASDDQANISSDPSPRQLAAFQQEVSTPLLSSFSVQIQPMLTRSCATAGCHDATHKNGLALQRSPRPVAHLTQQNLRAVLAEIDRDDPDNSPILAYAVRPHGGPNSRPFAKGAGDPAYATLSEWVRAVSGKTTPKSSNQGEQVASARQESPTGTGGSAEASTNTPNTPTNSAAQTATPQVAVPPTANSNGAASNADRTTPQRTADPRSRPESVRTNTASSQEQASAPFQPIDPFDPEIFNRRFAPRPK